MAEKPSDTKSKIEKIKKEKAEKEESAMSGWQMRLRSLGRRARGLANIRGKIKTTPSAQAKDPGKRQRILFLSLIVVLFVFGIKMWGRNQVWEFWEVLLVALAAAVIVYVGLIWAFRFDLNRVGYFTVLPQPAIFTFSSVLFIELFFFQTFERIFESIIFSMLLIGYVIVLNIVFLTANIMNVSTVKDLPLLRVAQTSSYAISIFTVYFLTFSFIASGMHFAVIFPVLLLAYFSIAYLHISYLKVASASAGSFSFLLSWIGAVAVIVMLTWPLEPLFIALLPAAIVYVGFGLVMYHVGKDLNWVVILEYSFVILLILFVLLYKAKWGIGGAVFQ